MIGNADGTTNHGYLVGSFKYVNHTSWDDLVYYAYSYRKKFCKFWSTRTFDLHVAPLAPPSQFGAATVELSLSFSEWDSKRKGLFMDTRAKQ